jgi:hypothetical protein
MTNPLKTFSQCEVPHTPFDPRASFIGHLADAKMSDVEDDHAETRYIGPERD